MGEGRDRGRRKGHKGGSRLEQVKEKKSEDQRGGRRMWFKGERGP